MSKTHQSSWKLIATKECLELLVSGRFIVAAVMVFGLVATTVGVLTRTYQRELADYGVAVADRDESLRQYGHLNRITAWSMPQRPNPMTAMVRGIEQNANLESLDNDPLAVAYPLPDFTVVVGVLFSLLALLFAHDALSGEREDGTLRLLLAHDVSRAGLVIGKIAGRLAALLIPLVAGLLVGGLVLALSPSVGWSIREWGSGIAVGLAAALYVAVFICLGVMISAWTRTARTALVASLAAWVVFVLIVPNLSPYVAASLQPTGSLTQLQRRMRDMGNQERDELGRRLSTEYAGPVRERHPEVADYYTLDQEGRRRALAFDPRLAAIVDSIRVLSERGWDEANRIQSEAIEALADEFEIRQRAQIRTTEIVSSVSPYPAFLLATLDLTETGVRAEQRRNEQQEEWGSNTFWPWMTEVQDSLNRVDPTVNWSNSHTDLSGMPDFGYQREPLGSRAEAALPRFAVLMGFGFAFLAFGIVGFNRYDVR